MAPPLELPPPKVRCPRLVISSLCHRSEPTALPHWRAECSHQPTPSPGPACFRLASDSRAAVSTIQVPGSDEELPPLEACLNTFVR